MINLHTNNVCIILMNFSEFSEGIRSLAKTYSSEGLFRAYLGLQPTVVVFRADFVEKILSDQQNIKKHSNYRFLHPWLGLSVLTRYGIQHFI